MDRRVTRSIFGEDGESRVEVPEFALYRYLLQVLTGKAVVKSKITYSKSSALT